VRTRPLALAAAAAVAVLCGASTAHAESACISAYEQAQTLRKDGKLVSARAQAAICAHAECPALLAKDCSKWLAELEASTPTVVFDARTASGVERTDVRVKVDGAVLAPRLDGKAVAVDPGSRVFVFEAEGASPVERTILVREGERNRKIAVTVAAADAKVSRPVPTGTWIFGGVSVVALTTSAIFAIDAFGKKSDLDACKPRCAASDVDAMTTSFTVADVALGAGVMAGAAALYLYLTRPTAEVASSASARHVPFAAPVTGGGVAGFSARF